MPKSYVLALLLVLPHFVCAITGREDWPFTGVPMFSYYAGPETERYRFRFLLVKDNGEVRELQAPELGLTERRLKRNFFTAAYSPEERDGSALFQRVKSIGKVEFEDRLSKYFAALSKLIGSRKPEILSDVSVIRLDIQKAGDEKSEEVGVYNLGGSFTQTYRVSGL